MLQRSRFLYYYLPWMIGLIVEGIMVYYHLAPDVAPTELLTVTATRSAATDTLDCNIRIAPRWADTTQSMDQWISQHLAYAHSGTTAHRSAGLAQVSYVIGPAGYLRDPRLVLDPGHGRGADLLNAFRTMEIHRVRWRPAQRVDSCTGERTVVSQRLYYQLRYDMVWAVGKREYE